MGAGDGNRGVLDVADTDCTCCNRCVVELSCFVEKETGECLS